MGSIEFALAPVRSKILAPSCPQLYTTMNMCPMVSAGKKKRAAAPKRKAAKKMTKHQKIVEKKRKSRAGMTIAQCVCHALRNAAKKEGMTMHQIRMCLNRSGVDVSKFILKTGVKKMMKWKCLKHKRNNNKRYVLTGKRCPSHLKNKKVNKKRKVAKAQRIANRKFKNKMAKVAKKQARGGRTFEKCVHDLLKVSGKKTLNEICAKLCKQPGMKCNKFVLRHVMERLRAKKVVKIYQFRYSATGARFPPKKRGSKK